MTPTPDQSDQETSNGTVATRNVLLVFAKRPVPGRVKSRLAQKIGPDDAASIYRQMAENVWAKTASRNFSRWVVYAPSADEAFFRQWLPGAQRYLAQTGGDLGERMAAAVCSAFVEGPCAVAVVGTDLPDLDASIVERVFDRLQHGGAVLCPTFDGGFWCLAVRDARRGLFAGVDWASATVWRQTRRSLEAAGYVLVEGPRLRDVDTADDLADYPGLRGSILCG